MGDLGLEAVKISENFQRFVSGGNLFSDPVDTSVILAEASGGLSVPRFDISKLFTGANVTARIEASKARAAEGAGTAFGGFGSALAQETALQKAIRESAERFPEFFRT